MFANTLLQLIVLFLPTQLGLHFWPDFSRAAGIKVDYLSPTLHFTDLLIFLYLLPNLYSLLTWLKKHFLPISVFALFVTANTCFAVSPPNTFFWWLRIALYLLLFLCLRLNRVGWSQIKKPLFISTLLIILLETFQFISQSSLNSVFYFLGERSFSSSTSGLAKLSFFGQVLIRPMSTFSHPNSLAGYLLVVYYLFSFHRSSLWQKNIILVGILLTFSKAALLALLLISLFPAYSVYLSVLFLVLSFVQIIPLSLQSSYQFISDRAFLLLPIKDLVTSAPLFGVGLGGFIPYLSKILSGSFLVGSKLQPVHNLPLLLLSEIGIVGSSLLLILARRFYKKISNPRILGLLAIILITGTFDHYWLTLPQNKLILLLAMAVLL